MKLSEIKMLAEAYKEKIGSLDEVKELIQLHCKDALKSLATPIVRGMTDSGPFLTITGADGERRSRNTTNHYTVIMDEVLPPEFPRRSKSIICANWANYDHAAEYGTMYMILPYDGVEVAWCEADDIFAAPITIAGRGLAAETWNQRFRQMKIPDTSYGDIVAALTEYRDVGMVSGTPYQSWVDDVEDFDAELREAYDEPFDWSTTKNPRWNDGGDPRELWIGGKCLAIRLSDFDRISGN